MYQAPGIGFSSEHKIDQIPASWSLYSSEAKAYDPHGNASYYSKNAGNNVCYENLK